MIATEQLLPKPELQETPQYDFLLPVVTGWLGKIEQAREARKGFDEIAKQCNAFFSESSGFMWEENFRNKYIGGSVSPKFKITIQKAFELVALFGPVLYWKNPIRTVKPRKQLEFSPEMFGNQDDPQAQQMYQMAMQRQQQRAASDDIRSQLLSRYLNYTPGEQPDGGLAQHSELSITEALVTGRGVLWPKPYKMSGSNRTLTGCFWDSQNNLLIDPDATSFSFDNAWWIAQEITEPVWKVERDMKLPPGSLEGKGNLESANQRGSMSGDVIAPTQRAQGKSNDLITYHKIWSRMGTGVRLPGVHPSLQDAMDKVVGDFAYIVVAKNVPYPLNAPSARVRESDDDSIRKMFQWPIPFWRDNRWPCAVLDFYRKPNSAYPIAPMAPGLGELAYINVFISQLAGRAFNSSRLFIAVLEDAAAQVEPKLKSNDEIVILKLPRTNKSIKEAVQFLDYPQINADSWIILDRMMKLFEQRVGLSELLYGLNVGGVQSRTATDAESKRDMVSVRPDYMASKVEAWQSEVANMEKFCARWHVEGSDVKELVGEVGAQLWDQHISSTDPELVVREMHATVEAGSARKPNKQRDAHNINTIMPVLGQELSKHADATGDTGPFNALIKRWGEAIDQPVDDLMMGERKPPEPPPEAQQAQQQQQELEMAKQQAEVEKKKLEAQVKQIDLQGKQVEMQNKANEAQTSAASAAQDMQIEQTKNRLTMIFDQQTHRQELEQDAEVHDQEMAQTSHENMAKLDQLAAEGDLKLKQARSQPSSNGSKK